MADTLTAQFGLKKRAFGDLGDWASTIFNPNMDALDLLIYQNRTQNGIVLNPNTSVAGAVGQMYFNVLRKELWVCSTAGGIGTTTWLRVGSPLGTIIMWSGTIGSIPIGWGLCNGTVYGSITSPDLRGRFIVGYNPGDADYDNIGDSGGEKTHILVTAEMPAHTHSVGYTGDSPNFNGTTGQAQPAPGTSGSPITPYITGSAGGGTAHENRPPFYTLAYLIKHDA